LSDERAFEGGTPGGAPQRRRGRFQRRRREGPPAERGRPGPPAERRREGPPPDRGQAGAVNRSRPLYPDAGNGAARRGPSNGRGNGPSRGGPRGPNRGPNTGPNRGPNRGYSRYSRPRDEARPGNGAVREARPFFADEDEALPDNPREAALQILHAVETRGAFGDRMLDGAHARAKWDDRDQALLHELVKGGLRWRGRVDYVLDPFVHVGFDKLQPWIRNVLRLGAYQILFLDRVPEHAAVDESVKLAHKYGHPGLAGLVNSVLRRLIDEKASIVIPEGDDVASLSAWGSHPEWIVERWLERFGVEATRALLQADNRPVPVGLRVNTTKGTREQLIERLAAEGVKARPAEMSPDLVWVETHQSPGRLKAFREGWCTAQDESESLVARLVGPRQHERLLDLCAAPGGKCTHLAELMGDEGEVWAMERDAARVTSVEQTIARLGIHSIHVVHGDGRNYAFPMPFDRVLVDAPCSGLGVLGRRADARWRKGPEILREMPPIQLDLLNAAGRRLRPGGVLVYSVCSFEPEETVVVVERFLRANPSFVLEAAAGLLPDEVVTEDGFMLVLPHVHGCDGAFAARLRKA
jgi:16S rRNA (cytosine967-C5)-methyltransferase